MTSYHARSDASRATALLAHLRGGADLALVTDAGTPTVSDPGGDLVAAWAAEGGRVVPIPGPSAVLAAVAGSGVAGPRWTFEGFLPRSGRERRDRLERIAADERGTVIYEAPGRVAATLRDLADGVRRRAARGGLPGADQDPRGDRPGTARRACRRRCRRRDRPARRVRPRRRGMVGSRPDAADSSIRQAGLEAALDEVERLVGEGVARGEAARRVAARDRAAATRLVSGTSGPLAFRT